MMYGWVGLVALGVAYDFYAIKTRRVETLSEAAWRLRDSGLGSLFGAAMGAALWHLVKEGSGGKSPGTSR